MSETRGAGEGSGVFKNDVCAPTLTNRRKLPMGGTNRRPASEATVGWVSATFPPPFPTSRQDQILKFLHVDGQSAVVARTSIYNPPTATVIKCLREEFRAGE